MNVILIDDERLALDLLTSMLKEITEVPITIKGAFTNVQDAYTLLEKVHIDIVFLDMEMGANHGINVASEFLKLNPKIQIIFITAHAQFAVDAFTVGVTDYLMKPVHRKRLQKALIRANESVSISEELQPAKQEAAMYARTFGSFQLLDVNQQTVKWRTKKVRELFLYLWFHQKRPILNVVITETLWPDVEYEKAATNLHTTIYQLRKLLKQNGIENPIQLVNNHYQFNIRINSDYDEMLTLLDQPSHSLVDIQQILNLYRGDFLEEEELNWATQTQIFIKQSVLHILESYATSEDSTNSLLKLSCLQKMLELDEYNEQYMYLLMKFLAEQNKKIEFIQLYEHIKEKLERDLAIPIPYKIKQVYEEYIISLV